VNGNASDSRPTDSLDLTRVHSCMEAQPEWCRLALNNPRAADCSRGTIESREEAVACRVHFYAAEYREGTPGLHIIPFQDITPRFIAKRHRTLRGACYIEKQDRRENTLATNRRGRSRDKLLNQTNHFLPNVKEEVAPARE
jgi:hypothetical protein